MKGEVMIEFVLEEFECGVIVVMFGVIDGDGFDVLGFDDVDFGIVVKAGVKVANFGEGFDEIIVFDVVEGLVFELLFSIEDEDCGDVGLVFGMFVRGFFGDFVFDFGVVAFVRARNVYGV